MKHDDRRLVTTVIENNSRRVPVSELAASGKRHVRVIPGGRALDLIEAIVDQVIAERAGQLAAADRDQIVQRAQSQYRKLAREQADAESRIARLAETVEAQRAALAKAKASLARREKRLRNSKETILSYDAEINRLQALLRAREEEIARLSAGTQVQADLAELKGALLDLGQRMVRQGDAQVSQVEARLADTLDKVRRTIQASADGPLDNRVEATDAYIAAVFDEADQESNLDRLDVDVSTTPADIAASLRRLRELRGTDEEQPAAGG